MRILRRKEIQRRSQSGRKPEEAVYVPWAFRHHFKPVRIYWCGSSIVAGGHRSHPWQQAWNGKKRDELDELSGL